MNAERQRTGGRNITSSNRVFFTAGEQREFINSALQALSLTSDGLAEILNVSGRTLRDWRREKFSIPEVAVKDICSLTGMPQPTAVQIKSPYWYASKGGKIGAAIVHEKYEGFPVDAVYRERKWREWWAREGRYKSHPSIGIRKKISVPELSDDLAEFVGLMLGDGSITPYQVSVWLSSKTDREYSLYVVQLIKRLFKVPLPNPVKRADQNLLQICVSRRELVEFCRDTIGLVVGNKLKQYLDIPAWIFTKTSYQRACLRGLMDTDGGIFYERHRINQKVYSYPRLSFVSYSPALILSVNQILLDLSLSPCIRRSGKAVQLEKKSDIRQYFETVGSNNPKHYERFLAG